MVLPNLRRNIEELFISITTAMYASAKIRETFLKTFAVFVSRHTVHARDRFLHEPEVGFMQKIDADVMEQHGEMNGAKRPHRER